MRPLISLVVVLGVIGFVGLLIASHSAGPAANSLRIAALAWFFGFGAIYVWISGRTDTHGHYRRRRNARSKVGG